jgi:hypothetical protein
MFVSGSKSTVRSEVWQDNFVAILPQIQVCLQAAFRHLRPEAREDAVADGVIHCLLSYVRLYDRRCVESVTPASLAWYAALQVRSGRQCGCRLNSKEPLAKYARFKNGFTVMSLSSRDQLDGAWLSDAVDSRRSSVADQVAIKLDLGTWLSTLCKRTRVIATDLAMGYSTSEVARKHQLTPGRISQLRQIFKSSWQKFQGETGYVAGH